MVVSAATELRSDLRELAAASGVLGRARGLPWLLPPPHPTNRLETR